jgi:hypothetical protein
LWTWKGEFWYCKWLQSWKGSLIQFCQTGWRNGSLKISVRTSWFWDQLKMRFYMWNLDNKYTIENLDVGTLELNHLWWNQWQVSQFLIQKQLKRMSWLKLWI